MLNTSNIYNKLFDLSLRALTLGGRFVLIFAIANMMSSSDVALFGILGSLISYLLYFLGLDFYTYSSRDILFHGSDGLWTKLYNQFIFFLLNYFLLAIFSQYIFEFANISSFLYLGFALAVSEHLSQEIYRLLIIVKEVSMANFQIFIRSGAWCYIVAIAIFFDKSVTLKDIATVWLVFSVFSLLFGLFIIVRKYKPKLYYFKIDYRWIQNGIKVSGVLFIGTLFLRGIFFFDKIILQYSVSLKDIGIYVFYFGITSALQSFVDILIISRIYPGFVQACKSSYEKNDFLGLKKQLYKFCKELSASTICLSFMSIVACYVLVFFMGNKEYLINFSIYISLCALTTVFILSMPFHYLLYALKKDRLLVFCNIIAFILFSAVSYGTAKSYPELGLYTVILGMFIAYIYVIFTKYVYCKRILSRNE